MNFLKKYYTVITFCVLILSGTLVYYLININQNLNYEVIYIDNLDKLESDKEVIKIALYNEDNVIEIVEVERKDKSFESIYDEVFALYNEYQNSLPVGYESPFKELLIQRNIDVSENGDTLVIEIEKIDSELNFEEILECLKQTYELLGIKHISLKIGKSEFNINL